MTERTQAGGVSDSSGGEARRWIFGRAVLDERTLELSVDGAEVEIERKPFEVLRFLLHHAGEVVTKDELLAGVWPGRVLSDTVLAKAISRLREVLHDTEQEIIKTVHGYGYRFVAPLRVELQQAPEPAHFSFAAGDHPPERPLWSLVHRLGAGGHGEAWLARHDKTHEQRVFKFALDESTLGALKREITLFRFLNDSLGERARIVPLMDWNLEQPPYFIESQYIAGGSLIEWAERSGGLANIPLATRIDIAAQIADALAAVHGIGVLHKDLKPSNVLITAVPPLPQAGEGRGEGARSADVQQIRAGVQIRLADFGSGGVIDLKQLEALGITRMGFTKTVAALGATSGGTPLYLAPELLAGQPATVKADLYALGVMLYQLAVGDFRRVMAPGWEHEVDDELLRRDIAAAAEGDFARRLDSAAELAQRLRTLPQRHARLDAERSAQAQLERVRLAEMRHRARRSWMIAAGTLLLVGTVTSSLLYLDARKSRDEAVRAAAASQAVADFLSKDMFTVVSTKPLRDLTVPELLDNASTNLARREADMPEAATRIHAALGAAFWAMEQPQAALSHLQQALQGFEAQADLSDPEAVTIATQLLLAKQAVGQQLAPELPRFEAVLTGARHALGEADPRVLSLAQQMAWARFNLGQWRRAADDMRAVIAAAERQPSPDLGLVGPAETQLGRILIHLGAFKDAAETLGRSIERLTPVLGKQHLAVAGANTLLAQALIELQDFDTAETQLDLANEAARAWAVGDKSMFLSSVHTLRGLLRLRQGRVSDAINVLKTTLRYLDALPFIQTTDFTYEVREMLAQAYRDAGELDAARDTMARALQGSTVTLGAGHPIVQRIRIGLADIERLAGHTQRARAALDAVDRAVLAQLGPHHPILGELRRVEGLVWLAEQRPDLAKAALTDAQAIFVHGYGADHAFSQRARQELARVDANRGARASGERP